MRSNCAHTKVNKEDVLKRDGWKAKWGKLTWYDSSGHRTGALMERLWRTTLPLEYYLLLLLLASVQSKSKPVSWRIANKPSSWYKWRAFRKWDKWYISLQIPSILVLMLTTIYARLFTPVVETKSVEQSVSTPNALIVVTIPRDHCYNLRPKILESKTLINCVISGFRRRVNEILTLLVYYAA
jgi:hypothetical protein